MGAANIRGSSIVWKIRYTRTDSFGLTCTAKVELMTLERVFSFELSAHCVGFVCVFPSFYLSFE